MVIECSEELIVAIALEQRIVISIADTSNDMRFFI